MSDHFPEGDAQADKVIPSLPTLPELIKPDTPPEPADPPADKCMGKWKHAWSWVWENGVWTNDVRCSGCGIVKPAKRFAGQ